MVCLICGKEIVVRRNWETLFTIQKYLICEKCYQKYQIKLNYQVVPTDNNILHVYTLFEENYHLNMLAYAYELGLILKGLLKKIDITNDLILMAESLNELEESFDMIGNLGKNIYIIVFYV